MDRELDPLHAQLDDEVQGLSDGLSNGRLAEHVREAEEHAKQLNESAAILDGWIQYKQITVLPSLMFFSRDRSFSHTVESEIKLWVIRKDMRYIFLYSKIFE